MYVFILSRKTFIVNNFISVLLNYFFMKGEYKMYEIFEQLLKKHGITPYKVSKATGISTATLSDWKNGRSIPKSDKMQILADYFGVSFEYLTTGRSPDSEIPKSGLTLKDERDISKDLNNILEKLSSKEDGPINFNGIEMSDETAELFKDELELMLKRLKLINKTKYNPNKNKSR